MYECPNCAANLKFHIGLQKLYCEHCESTLDPYSFNKEQDAEENDFYEVTVFHCPQCGGELLTEDTTAATFCSYCDGSTILDSRISQEKRPKSIIPFKKTKEDCRAAYQKMMKRAFFAPKELKDANNIAKFRGIYMPYWVYSFSKHGEATFKGDQRKQDGNFIKISHYDINNYVDAEYSDIVYDASSTFYDNLSAAIGPFNMRDQMPFTPSFLSGFYADSSDVDNTLYQQDAEALVMSDIHEELKKQNFYSGYNMEKHMEKATLGTTLKPDATKATLTMLPVWFLSYRKNDRVAYAVVNGQTGEAAADLPIDGKKFLLGSLLITLPVFLLLNIFFTLTPSLLVGVCGIIASLFAVVANNMTTDILFKESYEDSRLLRAQDMEKKRQKEKLFNLLVGGLVVCLELPFILGLTFVAISEGHSIFLLPVIALIFIIYLCLDLSHLKKPKKMEYINEKAYHQNWEKKLYIMVKPLFAIALTPIIIVINPVSDIAYYITALICIGILLWCIYDIISCHNILTTRKLPQLNKRGGEHLE